MHREQKFEYNAVKLKIPFQKPQLNVNNFSPSGSMPSGLSGGPTASANFKVSMWQNRNFDSGVQTMLHSQVDYNNVYMKFIFCSA